MTKRVVDEHIDPLDVEALKVARRHLPQSLAEYDAHWDRSERNQQTREARRQARAEREATG